jgi:hypothetical protein
MIMISRGQFAAEGSWSGFPFKHTRPPRHSISSVALGFVAPSAYKISDRMLDAVYNNKPQDEGADIKGTVDFGRTLTSDGWTDNHRRML